MQNVRHSLTGAAVSGALAFFAGMSPAEAAEPPVGEFKVGTIWQGSAGFYGPGNSFASCGMAARFPEGLELTFSLDAKGALVLDIVGPDEMDDPTGNVPATLSIDGRPFRTLSMKADEAGLELDELWLYTDLKPAADYLAALKKGKTITVAIQGQTMEKPPKDKTWTYTAALTGSGEAFQALEACVAKYAGTARPGAAPTAGSGGATTGPTKGSTGATKKAASFGAIAVGEDDEGLVSGISVNHPSLDAAMMAAVESCQSNSYGGICTVRATMDRNTPCGAIAGGKDGDGEPVYGWGTGMTKPEADLGAMEGCSGGAFGCQVKLSRCLSE